MPRTRKKTSKKEAKYLKRIKRRQALRDFLNGISLRENSDRTINICVFLLMCFGTAMIASVAVGATKSSIMTVIKAIVKQISFLLASYICIVSANKIITLKRVWRLRAMLLLIFVALMIIPFAFPAIGGSHAWIQLPIGVTFQPSEFGKPLIILFTASAVFAAIRKRKMQESFWKMFSFPLIAYGITLILLVLQKDFGTLMIISGIFYFCLMVPSYPKIQKVQRIATTLLVVGALSAGLLFFVSDIGVNMLKQTPLAHIATRIENMKNPFNDIYGNGYQPANSLYGIADSNIFGKGFGNSSRKYGYLTQADNDYILAVTIEETGIFGLGFILLMYALIEYRLFYYALRTRDVPKKIILIGTGAYLFMHFALNVGGVGALIPMTGIPLLYISSGGSSILAISLTIGVAQQCISRIREQEMKGEFK
ncbi:FtsW/RodA/SpoVE family cell cycle protein [Dubosiella newyorkensis]|jgi:cell division protein FtsW|uniref:FtsW/RodA/SpoVE family cell cycle protein n=1 Tax=Dubosiella newyorkensis TaxID=1862672 RepID=UPI00235240B0|nr:FtsW/RodA/SpoVE family cell cycle protein [Dubosiella newyorkensis]MCI9041583.1 FtsW/RodA/SpoVE family cell cycle protein [Dubosiella newyorkensis]